MNKKNLIQIVVIVFCLAASAIVIYNNFFKKPELPPGVGVPAATASNEPILPNGTVLDFTPVEKPSFNFQLLDYPKLSYPDEVGVDQGQMLKSILPPKPANP